MSEELSKQSGTKTNWIPLRDNLRFLLKHPQLLALTTILLASTILLTFLGYSFVISFFEDLTRAFFKTVPSGKTAWDSVYRFGWYVLQWVYLISTRLIAFYIALLVGYSITAPGYMFLSNSVEKIDETGSMDGEQFEIEMLVDDLFEGLKIAGVGILIAIFLFFITFVPVFGIIVAFIVLSFYSALMFIDFPTSKRHWTLSQKFRWIYVHPLVSARLGFIPALVGIIPILNVVFIAFLFPLFTVHTTRNFTLILRNDEEKESEEKQNEEN